jgi:uncharacterized membrane protein
MSTILIFILLFTIILKFYPPKKPNYYYGYQLGSAKKSLEHWNLANKYAANYLLFLYSFLLILAATLKHFNYENNLLLVSFLIFGNIYIYILIEKKLKS